MFVFENGQFSGLFKKHKVLVLSGQKNFFFPKNKVFSSQIKCSLKLSVFKNGHFQFCHYSPGLPVKELKFKKTKEKKNIIQWFSRNSFQSFSFCWCNSSGLRWLGTASHDDPDLFHMHDSQKKKKKLLLKSLCKFLWIILR